MLARALTCLLATVPLFFMPAATAAPAFLSVRSGHDQVARWNPCEPIGYRINPAGAPPGAVAEVREAVARISAATNLTFPQYSFTPTWSTMTRRATLSSAK